MTARNVRLLLQNLTWTIPALIATACSGGSVGPAISSAGGSVIKVVQQQPPSQILKFLLPTAGAQPSAVAFGTDSNYWVTEGGSGKIARVSNLGAVTEYSFTLSHAPSAAALGPGPTAQWVWTADATDAVVAQVSPAGAIKEFKLPAGSSPQQLHADGIGDEWVTEAGTSAVAKINSKGTVTTYPLPAGSKPFGIVYGPDKNMWVTEQGSTPSVATIVPSTGAITQYPLTAGRVPTSITEDFGYLWFGESSSTGVSYLARMSTTGSVTEYKVPNNATPEFLTYGPLSAVWFSSSAPQLDYAVIGSKGSTVSIKASVSNLNTPVPIAVGGDNNIWYPDPLNNSLDVYVLYPMTVTASSISFTAVAQMQSFSVSETHHTGSFYAVSSNTSVATVSPSSGTTFTVTANAPGTATITVSDNASYPQKGNGTSLSVTVTTTNITIN